MNVDLDARRTELVALRERVLRAANDIVQDDDGDTELSSAAGDQHLADHAGEMFNRELDDSLGDNAGQLVREIDVALARIDGGTYGTCARCGRSIPEERLEAVPYAVLCLDCKRLEEHA
jgi:RNA polymerase-binding protein DksA